MDIVYTAMPYVLEVVACLVVTAIGVAGTYLSLKAGQSKKFDTLAAAVDQVVLAAQLTVRELQQIMVEKMKERAGDGKLTPTETSALRDALVDKAKQQLSAPVVMVLEAAKVDVNALILSAGEAMINEMKNG